MHDHEMLYAIRLAKSARRFVGWKSQQEKAAELHASRQDEQVGMMGEFFGGVERKVAMKTRAADRGATKKKYYRQPKVYQKNYVAGLRREGSILLHEEIEDKAYPGVTVLYLLFRE